MKANQSSKFLQVIIVSITVMFLSVVQAQRDTVDQVGTGVNLAVVAVPSSSYVSGDTTLAALKDG